MSNADKTFSLDLFQAAIDALLDMRKIGGFSVMITMSMFINWLSMKWDVVSMDSMCTGWLGQPNLFGPRDEEADNALNV